MNFQAIRLVAEAGRAADLELKALQSDLEVFRTNAAFAENTERELRGRLQAHEKEIGRLERALERERAEHEQTHLAWTAKWDEAVAAADQGSPEEEQPLRLEESVDPRPEVALVGPVEELEKTNMETE
jgi:septal ring factor EnvC (AmiA/AmiB activator)